MEKLKALAVSRQLQRVSGNGSKAPVSRSTILPRIRDLTADVTIPRDIWSSWRPDFGARGLRRELTGLERGILEHRRDELAPALEPYQESEVDAVVLALLDMFGGFSSMRQTEDGAVARVDSCRRVLAKYPMWAIRKACADIHENGVLRAGKYDRQWPPNDAEIVDETRRALRLYGDAYNSAVALLAAEVER